MESTKLGLRNQIDQICEYIRFTVKHKSIYVWDLHILSLIVADDFNMYHLFLNYHFEMML